MRKSAPTIHNIRHKNNQKLIHVNYQYIKLSKHFDTVKAIMGKKGAEGGGRQIKFGKTLICCKDRPG